MKETIILSEINERELLRTLAIHNIASFNTRIFNTEALAKEVLLRSGFIVKEKKIDPLTQICIVYKILKEISYFQNNSFEDARHVVKSLNYARQLCRGNENEKLNDVLAIGEFEEKNAALLSLYHQYQNYLKTNNMIDSIGIINLALNKACSLDADFKIFKETPLDPLSEELLKKISHNKYAEITIKEFARLTDNVPNKIEYTNAYGAINEVEHIIGTIAREKYAYEDCTVALIDDTYLKHFQSFKENYDVPLSFERGLEICNFNSFKLLVLLARWNNGYNSLDVLNDLLFAKEFNTNKLFKKTSLDKLSENNRKQVIKIIGNLRLSVNDDEKLKNYKATLKDDQELKIYPFVEALANEFYQGYEYLIATYTKIDDELEPRAIKFITSSIEEYKLNMGYINLEDLIKLLGNQKIGLELSQKQTIHITDLKGALACVRKHLFICGLNAKTFPGSPKEDYLLLDSDLKLFNENKVKDSATKIKLNVELLKDVIRNGKAFGSDIHLSYAGYNLAELKIENPSSLLFEIFKEENGPTASTDDFNEAVGEQCHYFDEQLGGLVNVGNKYLQGINTLPEKDIDDEYNTIKFDRTLSPSAIDDFFACPKHFYLTRILGLDEIDDDDPFNVLPANEEGSLIHDCMKNLAINPAWQEADFMKYAEDKLDEFFLKRIPIHTKTLVTIKKSFLKMANNGFKTNLQEQVTVEIAEEKLGPLKDEETGLTLGGVVDRVEKLPDGKYRIVDYKTGRKLKHNNDDVDSCLQVLLYAYILEKLKGYEVKNCEYRYLRLNQKVECIYNEAIKEQLRSKLRQIKEALDSGIFPYATNKDTCKYCKLAYFCGLNDQEEIKEENENE